ncbi:MAG: 4Fe-4S dicluster domain-containing protein [Candidatus Lokiarchaeota archaeon]|nr:4Fe-4S dicluster domain-containing protein [Candidatus Lokiarchaeota archaeon]
MLKESLDVYRKLQKHLDTLSIGFPATKSGVEIRILKYLFTPEEAELATYLSENFESVEEIYDRAKKLVNSIDELEEILRNMVKKGCLHYKIRDQKKLYANAYLIIGMYEFQVNRLTKEFLANMSQYAEEALGLELFGYGISQFRTVPVEASLTPEHHLPTYDELISIIETVEGPISIANCVCRQGKELIGEPCQMTTRIENCLGFGDLAQMYIEEGWGREISRKEAIEVLRKNQEEGLILQGENAQRPGFICSCCSCCCGVISTLKEFPNVAQFLHPRYHAEVDSELCVGCGTCIDRCQLNAIKMRKERSKINIKRCIGCGNCIAVCPENAISLIKREKKPEPPETIQDMYAEILATKQKMKGIK